MSKSHLSIKLKKYLSKRFLLTKIFLVKKHSEKIPPQLEFLDNIRVVTRLTISAGFSEVLSTQKMDLPADFVASDNGVILTSTGELLELTPGADVRRCTDEEILVKTQGGNPKSEKAKKSKADSKSVSVNKEAASTIHPPSTFSAYGLSGNQCKYELVSFENSASSASSSSLIPAFRPGKGKVASVKVLGFEAWRTGGNDNGSPGSGSVGFLRPSQLLVTIAQGNQVDVSLVSRKGSSGLKSSLNDGLKSSSNGDHDSNSVDVLKKTLSITSDASTSSSPMSLLQHLVISDVNGREGFLFGDNNTVRYVMVRAAAKRNGNSGSASGSTNNSSSTSGSTSSRLIFDDIHFDMGSPIRSLDPQNFLTAFAVDASNGMVVNRTRGTRGGGLSGNTTANASSSASRFEDDEEGNEDGGNNMLGGNKSNNNSSTSSNTKFPLASFFEEYDSILRESEATSSSSGSLSPGGPSSSTVVEIQRVERVGEASKSSLKSSLRITERDLSSNVILRDVVQEFSEEECDSEGCVLANTSGANSNANTNLSFLNASVASRNVEAALQRMYNFGEKGSAAGGVGGQLAFSPSLLSGNVTALVSSTGTSSPGSARFMILEVLKAAGQGSSSRGLAGLIGSSSSSSLKSVEVAKMGGAKGEMVRHREMQIVKLGILNESELGI